MIRNIETRSSVESDWKPVFSFPPASGINVDYAAQYLDINSELGWDKYRLVTPDQTPWVDDSLGGRWSTEKMGSYKDLGSSFNFTYEPREDF